MQQPQKQKHPKQPQTKERSCEIRREEQLADPELCR